MKHSLRTVVILLFSLIFFSCNVTDKKTKDNLDLSDVEYDLNIDFSKHKHPLNKGTDQLVKELADYIYDNKVNSDERINTFRIRTENKKLLINYPIKNSPNVKSQSYFLAEPCKPKKKTCRSEKCVKKALKDIIGDGDRDVNIEYDRKMFKVEIKYTYQDC
ncbi:hypothetical protein [Fodinibius halophilus]|uniref:Lipoprotein n=1 Tax=Fodinibius halophilus TaxID=1736908 RepID=A0A6M1T4M1_9BACT|nr:hypothetical protein [Fodinibius halophilus]NGP86911.1 hypothetical protein [Fodinibius halophilus]